ncbi:hypothetical protein FBU30_008727 [Linnemannia zychae]|nr:hypothetical protein FBU30_008727 [Linnemannia zychae]
MTNTPRVVLGTLTFGLATTDNIATAVRVRGPAEVAPFLEAFSAHGHNEIDTARLYGNGDSEVVLSQILTANFKISTKAFPFQSGSHRREKLIGQFKDSLEALKTKKVDIFYLHAPDYGTSFEETLKAVDDLYREGLFERFGLSNYSAWQVALIYGICKQNGYVLPTVYQGNYNAISRSVVPELFACLKYYGISFYAFNPISGGILTGKYKFEVDPQGTRFDPSSPRGQMAHGQYWKKANFEAVGVLSTVAAENNMTLLEASLRWMRHHSGLEAKDAVIIGASSIEQLTELLDELEKGPLPEVMVKAFDDAWEHVKSSTISYFLPQGAPDLPFNTNDKEE